MGFFAVETLGVLLSLALSASAAPALTDEEKKDLRDYSSGVIFLNNVGLMGQSPANPPKFLVKTVKAAANDCFPSNETARVWVEKMLGNGHPAAWNVFFIQSFRNSPLAHSLRQRYLNADENERTKMIEEMQSLVGNKMAYELLFESSFRPLLFTTAKSPPEDLAQCRAKPTSQRCWDDHVSNTENQKAISVCHWDCDQPQLYYHRHHPKESGEGTFQTQDGSFAFYLGNKGSWALAAYGEASTIPFTPPEGTTARIFGDGPYQRALARHRQTVYCETLRDVCPAGKVRPTQEITEAEGRACLARFFTGSQEALTKSPHTPIPTGKGAKPPRPGGR